MKTIRQENRPYSPARTITYRDSQADKEFVFEQVVKWLIDHGPSGESLAQSDKAAEDAIPFLIELSEYALLFKVTYDGEDDV